MSPGSYRALGAGETITWAIAGSSVGHVLVAATERGICSIAIADSPDELETGLRARFRHGTLVRGDDHFAGTIAAVVGFIDVPARERFPLPLDVRGTAFQHKVWRALQRIPAGSTVTYGDLALSIGQPRAARAVARACASNELAVAIPCHRVVRRDGEPGGYRWGVERKRMLLDREREHAKTGI
jgi:AraC family transcriptional regulator of adaptative response/methylated-DNA-[protein]-cysteine methyltransferase